jgi:tetratricopeptide (TPR) repeat protein
MLPPGLRRSLVTGLLLFVAALPLAAQLPGSSYGVIIDENNQPIPGVKITIKDPERPDFVQEEESDKRGRYRIRLINATVTYQVTLEKEGHATLSFDSFKTPARTDTRRNFEMQSVAAAAASGALTLDPAKAAKADAAEVYNQGVTALQAGDPDTARALFLTAIQKSPDLGAAHGALARVYMQDEEHEQAIEHALLAIENDSDVDAMQQVLYASYTATGQDGKAQEALEKLKAASPEKASQNLFNEAAEAYNKGDMEAAKAGFEQVLAVSADHAKAHYLLGLIYINEGNNARAKELLNRFLVIAPDDPDAATAKEMIAYLSQ